MPACQVYSSVVETWRQSPDGVQLYQFIEKDNVVFHSIIFPASQTVLKTSEHKFIIIRQRIISPTTLEGSPSLAVLAFLEILINRWGFLQMSGVIICCPVDQRLETSNSPGTRLSEYSARLDEIP
ncbi:hypothetical protein BDFG_08772 [Blastomyces dermatitidis ATCC 26199]|nr:hypothetical protein BDFG_08772 [Blastomyces dermatitidis ATCC 26199]